MDQVNVLIIAPARDSDMERIAAIDPRINVLDGRRKFMAEIRQTWPQETVRKYLPPATAEAESLADSQAAREEREAFLRQTDVICVNFPFPTALVSRAPRLKWLHQTPAGASNLRVSDIWGSSVLVTTSRGYGSPTAHAEWVLATMLMFSKSMLQVMNDKQKGSFDRRSYRSRLLAGKTVGVVGLGGIGKEVARLSKALGMRAIGTRRSAQSRLLDVDGVDLLLPPGELCQLLAESDFVVLSVQSTPETDRLIGVDELKAMKSSAYLINVARGEIVDEAALIRALQEGAIAGAALDVYENEFEQPPSEELLSLPNVIFAPHVSGHTEIPIHGGINLFCENLSRFLSGRELVNVVDWERGY